MKATGKAAGKIGNPGNRQAGWGARDWLLALGLVLATVLAFLPVWSAGFIWDDDVYVTANRLLTASGGLRRIWFSLDCPSQYFPLTYTTFWLERLCWGLHPAGYHAVNLVFHAVNALLVWRLLARLRLPGAWLGAALWALHPAQVESVAWITERKNVLMGFFFLLSLLAWTRFVEGTGRRPWRFYVLALVCCALALLAKTTACTLPAALLLVLWLQGMPIGWRRMAQVGPFVVLGIGMGLVTVWWERFHQGTQGAVFSIGPVERVLIASRALWFYAGKLVWPAELTFSYPRWTMLASDPAAYAWLLATVALGVGIWRGRRWLGRGPEVAAVYFAATLSPVLGLIMLWTFRFTFVADHYQYLACLGPLALAAGGIERGMGWAARGAPLLKPAGCAVLLTVLGVCTWFQCGQYADAETLWRATLARNPGCWLAHENLGGMLLDQGKVEEAAGHFKTALALHPDDEVARNNLGNVLLQQGKIVEAIAQFQKALEIQPNSPKVRNNLGRALGKNGEIAESIAQFRKALDLQPDYVEAHNNLGIALIQHGEVVEAVAQFRKALDLQPGNATARENLGMALLQEGDFDGAMACFEKTAALPPDPMQRWYVLGKQFLKEKLLMDSIACYRRSLSINPRFADAWAGLGLACFNNRQFKEAEESWQKALDINPAQPQILNNLASVLATASDASLRDGPRAVALAGQANELTGGGNPIVLCTLAAAYAEAGRFDEASATARKALAQAQAQQDDKLAGALQEQIKLYEAGRPMRQTQ